ncbi:MAG: phosphoribosylanthranilate isomerase [Candidatus Brocadiaceae bacterium]|nr:phosphoribosylanthranilate isomerase [Candidatus Brocadiaceae bacterium]
MVKVKICGITSATDALMAAAAGADAIGFNFFPGGPRYIAPRDVVPIRMSLPPFLTTVGVFVDAEVDAVRRTMEECGLDYAQLHGHETPGKVGRLQDLRLIKAIHLRSEDDLRMLEKYPVAAYLLDAFVQGVPGGTGRVVDWDLARTAASRAKVVLAGGLTPANVALAVEAARPFAVDVASGVEEAPGVKSRRLVSEFILAAKSVVL